MNVFYISLEIQLLTSKYDVTVNASEAALLHTAHASVGY